MDNVLLFTDGSLNVETKVGYGAFIAVSEPLPSLEDIKSRIELKKFEETSSTKLELQTFLWALKEIIHNTEKVTVYTDSQNIVGLKRRRHRFEKNNYRSKKNVLLNNHKLYREFFKITDSIDCEIVKVRGHSISQRKDEIDRIFTLVDRASRNALRRDC